MKRTFHGGVKHDDVLNYVNDVFDGDFHAKRIASLAGATAGVLASGSLAISAIGLGLAYVCGTATKHAAKQVDRNRSINPVLPIRLTTHETLLRC